MSKHAHSLFPCGRSREGQFPLGCLLSAGHDDICDWLGLLQGHYNFGLSGNLNLTVEVPCTSLTGLGSMRLVLDERSCLQRRVLSGGGRHLLRRNHDVEPLHRPGARLLTPVAPIRFYCRLQTRMRCCLPTTSMWWFVPTARAPRRVTAPNTLCCLS